MVQLYLEPLFGFMLGVEYKEMEAIDDRAVCHTFWLHFGVVSFVLVYSAIN